MNSKFFNNDDETAFPFKKKKVYKKKLYAPFARIGNISNNSGNCKAI